MRNILAIIICTILGICVCNNAAADTVINGNVIEVTSSAKASAEKTDFIYKDKSGKEYPVYKTKNNKFFVEKVSKNGNTYKYYLPANIQEKLANN